MSDSIDPQRATPRRLSGFSFARQWRLTRKELAETLRDRRTIITLILMPVLVYPLLSIVFRQFLATSLAGRPPTVALIGVDDEATAEKLSEWLKHGEVALQTLDREGSAGVEPPLVDEPAFDNVKTVVGTQAGLSATELLKERYVDLAVTRLQSSDERASGPGIEIIYPEHSATAAGLRSFIERRIRAFNLAVRKATGNSPENDLSVLLLHQKMASANAPARSLLPSVVPLVLLMMTITGAVYPAIDLTAGERERGTLEALIAAPVSRIGVLMAKYVAVLTVALLTAGMNLAAMSLTIYSTGLMGMIVGPKQNPVWLIVEVFGLLLLFAGFFSAVLLAVTSFAKSFKEAQAYLIPLMLVTLGPGLMSLSPTLELSLLWAVVPLVNVVLLARDVFAGDAALFTALVVVISTALYAVSSIALAARIFGSDSILYGSSGSWSDLFRRPPRPGNAPSSMAGLLCLAFVFAAMITLGGSSSLLASSAGPAAQVVTSGMVTVFVFLAIPLIAVASENVRLSAAFRTSLPRVRFWIAAVLLGASLGVLVSELTALMLQWKITTLSPELEQAIREKAAQLNELPLMLVIVMLAVVPAVAEELFFRGYLFRALERARVATIVATAVLFSLFHAFGATGVMLERLVPSLLMGIVLGLLAQRSGSVWPGIVLHALNNTLLLGLARNKDWLVENQYLAANSEHLPGSWLAVAGGVALFGLLLLYLPLTPEAADSTQDVS